MVGGKGSRGKGGVEEWRSGGVMMRVESKEGRDSKQAGRHGRGVPKNTEIIANATKHTLKNLTCATLPSNINF